MPAGPFARNVQEIEREGWQDLIEEDLAEGDPIIASGFEAIRDALRPGNFQEGGVQEEVGHYAPDWNAPLDLSLAEHCG